MLHSGAPTRKYLILLFCLSSILLAGLTAVLYRQSQISKERDEWVVHSYEVLRSSRRVMLHVLTSATGQRGYLLSGDKRFLEPYYESFQQLDIELDALQAKTADNAKQQAQVDIIREHVKEVKALLQAHLNDYMQKAKRITVVDLENSRRAMEKLRVTMEDFQAMETSLLQQRTRAAQEEQGNYISTLFVGALLAIGGLLLANMLILSLMARGRKVEEELKTVHDRFMRVMSGINDGIFDYDVEAGTIYFSPSYKAMLGYAEDEHPATLETFNALLHPDDYERVWETFKKYMRRDIPECAQTYRMRHKEGRYIWVLSRGVGIWNARGEITRLTGAHTDITQQKEREEELKQLNNDIEGFVYIVSHDLRSPLVNLKGFAGEMHHSYERATKALEKAKDALSPEDKQIVKETFEEDIPEALGFIRAAVDKMDKLTSAILDLSRIGRREHRPEEVDTQALVKRCLDTLAYETNEKKIDIKYKDLPVVYTDPLPLEQVFGNILDNAVKYLKPGQPGKITIEARQLPQEVLFSIADNGRGIEERDQRKVFDIFRRAGNSADVRGMGMGMAFVKATIRKLGGKIWFHSTLDEGTTFYFTIPKRT